MSYVNWVACEFYCDDCGDPDRDTSADVENEESDTPQHCNVCGRPFINPLTTAGVNYVLEQLCFQLDDYLANGTHIIPLMGTAENTMTYWHGRRHIEITRGWAQDLKDYALDEADLGFVDRFLKDTEEG